MSMSSLVTVLIVMAVVNEVTYEALVTVVTEMVAVTAENVMFRWLLLLW